MYVGKNSSRGACVDFPPQAENSARSAALAAGRALLCPTASLGIAPAQFQVNFSRQIGKNAPTGFYCAQPFTGRISIRHEAPKARHYTHHASAICRDAQKSVRTFAQIGRADNSARPFAASALSGDGPYIGTPCPRPCRPARAAPPEPGRALGGYSMPPEHFHRLYRALVRLARAGHP